MVIELSEFTNYAKLRRYGRRVSLERSALSIRTTACSKVRLRTHLLKQHFIIIYIIFSFQLLRYCLSLFARIYLIT